MIRHPLGTPADRSRADLVAHMIKTLNDESQVTKRLTTWETDFLASVTKQHNFGRELSEKQREALERIYAEKTA